jgi:lipoic acid synthetase
MEKRKESEVTGENPPVNAGKLPWLMRRTPAAEGWRQMKSLLDSLSLAAICEEAECPNIGECFR